MNTSNTGIATILLGDTSVTVAHGLGQTPRAVNVSPESDSAAKRWWSPAASWNGTTFTIELDSPATEDTSFFWSAFTVFMAPSPGNLGPCQAWTTGADVLDACGAAGALGLDAGQLDLYAQIASEVLYEFGGRRFPGLCNRTVRPCRRQCTCGWGVLAGGHIIDAYDVAGGQGVTGWGWDGGWWRNTAGQCGCGPTVSVKLSGFPVSEIVSVNLDGNVIDPSLYRIDYQQYLTALEDSTGNIPDPWPLCQDMSLPDTPGPGVFLVEYTWGVGPPLIGIAAANDLACQFALAALDPEQCLLPIGTVSVQRQGVTINKSVMSTWMAGQTTGLVNVDAFIGVYNPRRLARQPSFWSPDVEQPGRVV